MTLKPHPTLDPPRRPAFALPVPPAGKRLISLAINESAYGASPRATEAAIARLSAPHRYPDPSSNDLRRAIGSAFDLDFERILCGNGSEELLDVIGRLFARPGDRIIMSQSGFFQFALVATRLGAELTRAPERDLITNVDGLLALATPQAKLVYLAIPNNPTGLAMPVSEVRRLHAALPSHVVLVLDLAYGEYLPPADLAALMRLATDSENVVATRTFSKAYGLAALRAGWALAPEWMMPGLNLLRGVGNINAPAQAAAIAALADREFLDHVVDETAKERAFLSTHLARLGLRHVKGLGNFLLTEFPDQDGRRAQDFIAFAMREEGIWLRPVGEPGFPNHSRIGLGTRTENELVVATLGRFLAAPQP
ncbi:MAG: histidinol-phosphate transaminase [Hyphomicrobiales bacterium]